MPETAGHGDPPHPILGRLGYTLPEPLILLQFDGLILDANPAACRLLDRRSLRGLSILEFVVTNRDGLQAYLRDCAGSSQMVLGSLRLQKNGGAVDFRVEGATLLPASEQGPAILILRLSDRESANRRFKLLTDKIDQLSGEIVQRVRAESILTRQRRVLEMIAEGEPLENTLTELIRTIETHSSGQLLGSILLLEEGRYLRGGASPSLPEAYRIAIDGVEIGPSVGSCGAAAYYNQPVIVTDIATDPLWRDFRELALAHGLRACWSTPIRSRTGEVLGTFAFYYPQPVKPATEDERIVAITQRTAAIAIELKREEAKIQALIEREREARAEAEAANRDKDEFLAMISHELRNPLNSISGWLEVLSMDDVGTETFTRGFETIKRNADLQAKLISDTLDFARMTSNRMTIKKVPLRVDEVVEAAVAAMHPEAKRASVNLRLQCDFPNAAVSGDSDRLQQVVCNLLSNAIRYSPAGSDVVVAVRREATQVRIDVIDSGEGIPADFLPHVFERFRQLDKSTSRRHGGLGLGLAVVRYIVEAHGGTVHATSPGLGAGATFSLRLPAIGADRVSPVRATATDTHALNGRRVLVVDDQDDARDLLAVALTRYGAEVSTAASARQALDLLAQRDFDAVLSDIAMPNQDGYQFMTALRAGEAPDRQMPAVALTAHARSEDRDRALEAGYDEHVAKPVDCDNLARVIARLTERQAANARD